MYKYKTVVKDIEIVKNTEEDQMDKKTKQTIIGAGIMLSIILIAVIVMLVQKYTPSKEVKSLTEYYEVKAEEVLLLMQNKVYEKKGQLIDGEVYIDYDTVLECFNKRFYWDSQENVLVYTSPTEIVKAEVGSKTFSVNKNNDTKNYEIVKTKDETVYIAIDFVKQYSNLEYTLYQNPNRMVISYQWGTEFLYTKIKKATQLRVEASIKSPILVQLKADESLTYVDTDKAAHGSFSKVMTADGVIGYVITKALKESNYEKLSNDYVAPVYTSIQKEGKVNLVWHQVTNESANNSFLNMITETKGVTVVSPTWFSVASEKGELNSLASEKYVERAHGQGIEVWALVDDFDKKVDISKLLSYSSRREKLSNEILAAAIRYSLDGINIDFEKIPEEAGKDYIQFLRELSVKCRNNGIVLSIDNYVPSAYTEYYNREEQGVIADYVITMAYDEHYAGSKESGSVSSQKFVETAVSDILKVVPKEKVIIALPFYTRIWKEKVTDGKLKLSSEAYSMQNAINFLQDNGVEPTWNEETGQFYGEFESDGTTYRVWLEEETSFDIKLKAVFDQDVAGVAEWKLGLEKGGIWDAIVKYLGK